MTHISVKEAATQLDRLVRLASQGEVIVLTEADKPAARIVSVPSDAVSAPRKRRRAGSGLGLFELSPDFDAPLDDFAEYTA